MYNRHGRTWSSTLVPSTKNIESNYLVCKDFHIKKHWTACFLLSVFLFFPQFLYADEKQSLSTGQTIYVPAYSHIYIGNRERIFLLTITLSIRNIDPHHGIKIIAADYYETQGKLLKKYIETPLTLKPLESLRYVIPEVDKRGGSGANFMVEWKSDKPVNPPIVESIMISTKSQQGISFTSRGRPIINRSSN